MNKSVTCLGISIQGLCSVNLAALSDYLKVSCTMILKSGRMIFSLSFLSVKHMQSLISNSDIMK